jgi:hypothetical protein
MFLGEASANIYDRRKNKKFNLIKVLTNTISERPIHYLCGNYSVLTASSASPALYVLSTEHKFSGYPRSIQAALIV